VLETFAEDGLAEHGGRGGAVARGVARLAGDFTDHLGAHVFVRIGKLDLLGDSDTVLGHGRGTKLFVDHDVAALGPERRGDGLGELGDALEEGLPRGFIEQELFCCHSSFCFLG